MPFIFGSQAVRELECLTLEDEVIRLPLTPEHNIASYRPESCSMDCYEL